MGEFPQFVLVPMAIAALKQVLAWSVSQIAETLAPLILRIAEFAGEQGYLVLPSEQRCTHMIGIRHPIGVPGKLSHLLKEKKVFVSVRGDSIRIAPHLYNERRDMERLFEVLELAQKVR
jgi:selenocysteine lyase/cysteine desulfurase